MENTIKKKTQLSDIKIFWKYMFLCCKKYSKSGEFDIIIITINLISAKTVTYKGLENWIKHCHAVLNIIKQKERKTTTKIIQIAEKLSRI